MKKKSTRCVLFIDRPNKILSSKNDTGLRLLPLFLLFSSSLLGSLNAEASMSLEDQSMVEARVNMGRQDRDLAKQNSSPVVAANTTQEGMKREDNAKLGDEFDELLSGFDSEEGSSGNDGLNNKQESEEIDIDSQEEETSWTSAVKMGGYFKAETAYNFSHDTPKREETDWRGFSRLSNELYLEFDINLPSSWQAVVSGFGSYNYIYDIKGRDEFTDDVVDNYTKELEFRETYISGKVTDSIDIKMGRQTIVWGSLDNIRVTDVLNPIDRRELGITDLEDLRLPVASTRLDGYWENWSLSGIAIHEIRSNKEAEFGSDYFPGTTPLPSEKSLHDGGSNTELAAAINGIFSGWGITFYAADMFNDSSHFEVAGDNANQVKIRNHARLGMYGGATSVAFGNWLLKAEVAYLDGLEFQNMDHSLSRLDVGYGVEYAGFSDTTISLEAVNRHIYDFEDNLTLQPDFANKDEFQSVFRFSQKYLNQTLDLTFLASVFGLKGQGGAFERIALEYDIDDSFSVTAGCIFYQSGDWRKYSTIGDNDRVYSNLRYSF